MLRLFAPLANNAAETPEEQIDILISTDVLSEGQNLQDCGVIINYDLTWNPIRLVQRNGRIDRIGSPHDRICIYNMFPEKELERLLRLVERLTQRITQIDELGLLDASILGEAVHPRTFNTLRRIRDEDGAVLDEEEERAELAGPETMLKQLKELLNREGSGVLTELPDGIHSGLRRDKVYGMFFYFRAPRFDGSGNRHIWRFIDARTFEITDNRYEIAQVIGCQPDEPRYIGDQDVFLLQERVIDDILRNEREADARANSPKPVDSVQQAVIEIVKDAMRHGRVERQSAKEAIRFLGAPLGRFAVKRLRNLHREWSDHKEDVRLLDSIQSLAKDFAKGCSDGSRDGSQLRREELTLVCFEYITS